MRIQYLYVKNIYLIYLFYRFDDLIHRYFYIDPLIEVSKIEYKSYSY